MERFIKVSGSMLDDQDRKLRRKRIFKKLLEELT
jgi:hypothetical protein